MRKTNNLTGKILNIGKVQTFNRSGKPPISKQEIGLETEDGQKLFCEVRTELFEQTNFLRAGMSINFEYVFEGSEKRDKKYNNIVILNIKVV